MLFGYPIEATNDNWLHECLCQMIESIHACLDAGVEVPAWPDIIPDEYRDQLRSKTGIRNRLLAYSDEVDQLELEQRQEILNRLSEQNNISGLLDTSGEYHQFSAEIQDVFPLVKVLFEFAYDKLTNLGIRDNQYKIIYDSLPTKVCPFCGCEPFDAPGGPREDDDHYLAKSIYPFAAVNLNNLVPMGGKCNQRYKGGDDLIFVDGIRRPAINPYNCDPIDITLVNSLPFKGVDGCPTWNVEFIPDTEESFTWDEVFKISERYDRDVLTPYFKRWIDGFRKWAKRHYVNGTYSDLEILDILEEYIENIKEEPEIGPGFIKDKVFEMILHHCRNGDDRLIQLIRDAVVGIQEAA